MNDALETPGHPFATVAASKARLERLQMGEHNPEDLLRQNRIALLVGVRKIIAGWAAWLRAASPAARCAVFKTADFLAAAIDHIPPQGQQTIRYYGLYSNRTRGLPRHPPPPKVTARAMRPLWRDLILRVWGTDPLQCPCCQATMRCVGTFFRPGEIEFFLRLHGLCEANIDIPPPPDPPFDIETFEPIEPPWQAIREWIPDDDAEPGGDLFDQRPDLEKPVEIPREDGSILVLDSD